MPNADNKDNFREDNRLNRMGYVFLNTASDVLNMDLGIKKDKFFGSGVSSPNSVNVKGIPEYWVFNFNENDPKVWAWEFENPLLVSTKTVREALKDTPPIEDSDKTSPFFADCQNNAPSCRLDIALESNTRPALFRCTLFPPLDKNGNRNYKGTVGRTEAKRVFFSRYRDVIDLTVSDACAATGRTIQTANGEHLYIWIFIPTDSEEAVLATWGNLKANFENWEKKP